MNTIQEFVVISIIIPTYKPQNYIIDCLKSIEAQIFNKSGFEVVIILNGNRSPYYSFIEDILSQCTFLYKLFYTEIIGVSNARNIGIEQSEGRYLTFVDDDDIISENYLQELYDVAKNGVMSLSYSKAFIENITTAIDYRVTHIYNRMKRKALTVVNIHSYFSFPVCKLIDREIIGTQRFNNKIQNGEDALFMFAISKKIKKMQFTNKTAVYYRRIRNDSLMNRKVGKIYIIKNYSCMMFCMISLYLKAPIKYNFVFFVIKIFAIFKSAILMMKKNIWS